MYGLLLGLNKLSLGLTPVELANELLDSLDDVESEESLESEDGGELYSLPDPIAKSSSLRPRSTKKQESTLVE